MRLEFRGLILVLAILCVVSMSPAHAAEQSGKRYALVVGINGYEHLGKLEYCRQDAEAVAKVLVERAGFGQKRVCLIADGQEKKANQPTYTNLLRRFKQFTSLPKKGDTLLIFFAGHGVTFGKEACLMPIDGSEQRTGFSVTWLRERIAKCEATTKILILDACHSGKAARGVTGIAPSLVKGAATVVLTSCGDKQISYPEKGHGVFTAGLIDGLSGAADKNKDGRITGAELFASIQNHIEEWSIDSGKTQTPQMSPKDAGGIVLAQLVPRKIDVFPTAIFEKVPDKAICKIGPTRVERTDKEGRLLWRHKPPFDVGEVGEDGPTWIIASRDRKTLIRVDARTGRLLWSRTFKAAVRQVKIRSDRLDNRPLGDKYLVALAGGGDNLISLDAMTGKLVWLRRQGFPIGDVKERDRRLIVTSVDGMTEDEVDPLTGRLIRRTSRPTRGKHKTYTKWPFDAKEAKRRQEETARALGVPVNKTIDLGGGVKLELVLIPAGEFMMGSGESAEAVARKCSYKGAKPEWFNNEHPRHKVRITKPFYIGKYEVTQEQWEKLTGRNPAYFKGPKNPAERVSWNDCATFLKKLNARVNEKGAFALPTEAQWEYACRAGTATPFHTGPTISTDQANYDGDYTYGDGRKGIDRKKTLPAGSFRSNAFGLYDMHGNVYEWCSDWYRGDYYGNSPKDDPKGPGEGESRVLRSGIWASFPGYCRSADRSAHIPSNRGLNTGARVILRDFR